MFFFLLYLNYLIYMILFEESLKLINKFRSTITSGIINNKNKINYINESIYDYFILNFSEERVVFRIILSNNFNICNIINLNDVKIKCIELKIDTCFIDDNIKFINLINKLDPYFLTLGSNCNINNFNESIKLGHIFKFQNLYAMSLIKVSTNIDFITNILSISKNIKYLIIDLNNIIFMSNDQHLQIIELNNLEMLFYEHKELKVIILNKYCFEFRFEDNEKFICDEINPFVLN